MASSGVATSSKSIFGFDPRTVPGCQLWLDAADLATLSFSSGNIISTWKDKSINGVTLTAYGNPTTTTVNGRTSISLNGSTQYLQRTDFTPTKGATYMSWFAVANVTNYANANYACIVGTAYNSTFSQNTLFVKTGTGVIFYRRADQTANKELSSNSVYINTLFQTETDYVTGQYQISLNGGSPISKTDGITGAIDTLTVNLQVGWDSVNSYLAGTISECLLFTSPVSPANEKAIEGYLAWKWGLNISLPNYITTVFSPLSFTGCALWLDSSDSTTMFTTTGATTQSTNGTTVALWRDKSTSQNNFTAITGTPTLATDGILKVVNIPSGAIMRSASSITINSSSAFFIVHKITSIGDFSYLIGFSSGNGGNGDYSMRFLRGILNGTAGNPANGQDLANNYYVSGVLGGIANQYNNYYLVATNSTTSSSLTSLITLSSASNSRYYAGYIAEFIYYPAGLTPSQFNQIQNYLCLKWNVIRPANHPYAQLIPYSRSFQPTDIPGCQLWLDAADQSTLTLINSGANASNWRDKSGNSYNCSTSSGANSPAYSSSTQGLQFRSASTQSLAINQLFGDALVNTTFTIFCVGQRVSSGSFNLFLAGSPLTAFQTLQIGFNSVNTMHLNMYSTYYETTITSYVAGTEPINIYTYEVNTTNVALFLNGVTVYNTAATPRLAAFTTPEIGRRYGGTGAQAYHDFNLFEMIAYTRSLTTGQRQQIEGYLANKWRLQSSLETIQTIFSYTGATQTYTVPAGVTSLSVSLSGAGGASFSLPYRGGFGGLVTGTLTVTPGQQLTLIVGQGGSVATTSIPTFGGGGRGGINGASFGGTSASGGGRSAIQNASGVELVTAGGGGGTSYPAGLGGNSGTSSTSIATTSNGGGGGGATSSAAGSGGPAATTGTQLSGLSGGGPASSTVIGQGGQGGDRGTNEFAAIGGGGGGGGYYGGGGGGAGNSNNGGGGGGGSSYTTNAAFTLGITQSNGGGRGAGTGGGTGTQSGDNGSITITYIKQHPFIKIPPTSPSLFSPTNIGACAIWIDGNDPNGTGVVPASGATFATTSATIIDKSGNGYNLTPTATINYSTRFLNNMGVLNFGSARAQNSSFNWTTNFTQFVVVKGDAGNWGTSFINPTGTIYWSYVYANNNNLMVVGINFNVMDGIRGNSISAFTNTGKGLNAWTIFCIGYTAGSTTGVNYTLNGTTYSTATGTPFNSSQATNLTLTLNGNLGGNYDTGVYVAEFIHYNATLSTSQRQQVEGYLAGKWGLQGLLPTTHPYYEIIPAAVSSYYFYESFEIPANLAANLGAIYGVANVWGQNIAWNEWAVTGVSKSGVGSPWDPAGGTAAAGSWYAYIQGDGSTASRVFQGPVGYTATLSFSYGYRVSTSLVTSVSVTWTPAGGSAVTLPGSPFAMPSSATPWTTVTTSFVFTASSGTLIFTNNAPGQPDPSVLLDNILIT